MILYFSSVCFLTNVYYTLVVLKDDGNFPDLSHKCYISPFHSIDDGMHSRHSNQSMHLCSCPTNGEFNDV